jgi:hypothetical protein
MATLENSISLPPRGERGASGSVAFLLTVTQFKLEASRK